MEKLLKPEDVAEILQLSTKTVKDWLRAGTLKGVKMGKVWRIEQSVLDEYIAHQRELEEFSQVELKKRQAQGDEQPELLSIRCDSCGFMYVIDSVMELMEKAAQGEMPVCPECGERVEQDWIDKNKAESFLEYQEEMRRKYGRTWAEFEEKLRGGD